MDGALGINTCEEEGKKDWVEGKLNCNRGASEASADPMRSSRTETALQRCPKRGKKVDLGPRAPRVRDNLEQGSFLQQRVILGGGTQLRPIKR